MRNAVVPTLVIVALLGACGDDDGAGSSDVASTVADGATGESDTAGAGTIADDGEESSDGAVADAAPAGSATVSVDGRDLSFEEVLAGGCSISDEAVTFGFAASDGVTTLGAGLNNADGDWLGSIAVNVSNPDGEGLIGYYPAPTEGATLEAGSVSVDGSSMSYSGPMLMQPPNDGSNPSPVDVGDGTISATC